MFTLTAQSRAISAFTLAVLLVLGDLNRIALGIVLAFGSTYPEGRAGQVLTSLLVIGVAGAVTYFAANASGAGDAGATWDAHLARASVVIAAVGLLISVVVAIGSVANNVGGVPGGYGINYFF